MNSNLVRPKTALLIGPVWPEPQSSAAGMRSMSLIRILKEASWEVHVATACRSDDGGSEARLQALGVQTHTLSLNDSDFDRWVAELRPELVIFERFMVEEQFGWRVSESSPGSLRILDTVDLQFLRRARQTAQKPLKSASHDDTALREVASLYRCDLTLVISPYELALLTDPKGQFRVPATLLEEFSFCYDPPEASVWPGWKHRHGFAFIGSFRHEPNVDAVLWLKHEIWPEIRSRNPGAELHVYGSYPPRSMMDLTDSTSGFVVRGPAKDPYQTLQAYRVNLAPLRFGAGLKGKISDGWWSGTPCVATSVGAEGMDLNGLFGGLVADSVPEFVQAACLLDRGESLWTQAQKDGTTILGERFGHETQARRLLARLDAALANLDSLRANNFMGRMFEHHRHRSTKYFSQWIELKNKLTVPQPQA